MKPTLTVLAAGMGSRYGGLKQIDPIGPGGETIIDYSVFDAIRAGFGKIVFVIRRDIEKDFETFVMNRFRKHISVDYVFQELDMVPANSRVPSGRKKPWGTGHAILCLEEKVAEPFAVINADDFYGAQGFCLLAKFLAPAKTESTDFAMVGFTLRNTLSEHGSVARGVCQTDPNGFLQSVREITTIHKDGPAAHYTDATGMKRSLTGDEIVSMNMWGFTPSLFAHLRSQFAEFLAKEGGNEKAEFFIPTVIQALIDGRQARVKVLLNEAHPLDDSGNPLPAGDQWFGLTYREDRDHVRNSIGEMIRRNEYPGRLW